jgi:hypothetical protein
MAILLPSLHSQHNRNELDVERDRHREEVEELGGDVSAFATKLRQREEKTGTIEG